MPVAPNFVLVCSLLDLQEQNLFALRPDKFSTYWFHNTHTACHSCRGWQAPDRSCCDQAWNPTWSSDKRRPNLHELRKLLERS